MSSASRFSRIRIDTNVNREFGTLGSPIQLDGDDSTLGKSGIPSLLLAQSGYGDEDRPTPHTQNSGPNPKAKHEMRKLLTHVLVQLVNRRKPPSISDTIQEVGKDATEHGVAAFTDVFKDVAKIGKAIQRTSSKSSMPVEEDEEDEDPQSYTTEATFDLLLQLKDIMAMSIKQGWHIFGEECVLIHVY